MGIREKEWAIRTGNEFVIPHTRIRVGPWGNVRTEFTTETIAARANSLILKGQTSPVVGKLSEDGEWFELMDGEIRLRAWEYAKKELGVDLDKEHRGMRCKVQNEFAQKTPLKSDIIKLQLSYGTDSVPLSNYDKAVNVKKLIDGGEKIADIAKLMHCTPQNIRNLLAAESAPEHVKKSVKPTTAAKYSRSSEKTKKKIDQKISAGEKVTGKDIPPEKDEPAEAVQESINENFATASDDQMNGLTAYEIKQQIKRSEINLHASGVNKNVYHWQGFIRAMNIVLGKEKPI